jgi:hypothetical protein
VGRVYNEYVPLLESRQQLAEQRIDAAIRKLVTDSNVPTQRNRGRIVELSPQPFVNQLLVSLRRAKTESGISWPSKRKDVKSC